MAKCPWSQPDSVPLFMVQWPKRHYSYWDAEGVLGFPPSLLHVHVMYTCRAAGLAVLTLCGFSTTYNVHDVKRRVYVLKTVSPPPQQKILFEALVTDVMLTIRL